MSLPAILPVPRPSPFASLVGVIVAALWLLGLCGLCLPLWGLGIALLKLSNLSLALAYRLRDALELMGNKTEAVIK